MKKDLNNEKKKSNKPLNKKDKIIELQQKAGEYLAGWQRAKADYENLKRESEKSRIEFVQYANANLIIELLPVFDNFKAAFATIPEEDKNNAWVVGFQHIFKQLQDFFEAMQVKEIKTVGEQFNPEQHEAVEYVEDATVADNEIVKEIKSGYMMGDKVIQAAKVVVSQKGERAS